jgi:predicted transcriptional regulator
MQQFIKELAKGTNDYIEIREIDPEGNTKQHFLKPEDLKDYRPPMDKNIYFGVYSRFRKDGKAQSCSTTKALWVDYDAGMEGLTVYERVKKVQSNIKAAGLPEPSVLVSSGNGIHAYWILKERQQEVQEILKAMALATNGDMRATDKARIMRLPNTLNVKDINRPLKCEIVQADYSLIYDLEDIKAALGGYIGQAKEKPLQVKPEPTNTLINSINPDRPCIAAMLKGVPEGERNFALGRLTKWLQIKGYTKKKSQQVILEWNSLNNPPEIKAKLLKDFNYYWHGDYKLLGCTIDKPELQQILYKYCNRPECKFTMAIGNIELDNTIKYNNRLLNCLHELTGNDLIVYGVLLRHREGLTASLLMDKLTARATKKPCMSRPTMLKSTDTLRKKGFITITKGNRRAGKENLYKARPQGTYGLGYTLVSNGAINGAIDGRVTAGELRLYVLLLKYAYQKGSCYPSLDTLAKELRSDKSRISKQLKKLEKSDYIKRERVFINGVESLSIRLLM